MENLKARIIRGGVAKVCAQAANLLLRVGSLMVLGRLLDPKDFDKFGCVTCHGAQAKEGHFDMPNPDLPKLNFADMSKFKKEDIEWMKNEVMRTMGKILQLPLYSEENPKGFGCLHCHTQATGQ